VVTLVFANSGAGHFWPSDKSTTLPLQ